MNHSSNDRCLVFRRILNSGGYTQFVRYAIVGVVQNLIGYMLYLLITWAGSDPKVTITILYPIGFTLSFIGNKKWTFLHTGDDKLAFYRFALTHLVGYAINIALLYVFVDIYSYAHQYVQLLAMFILVFYFFIAMRTYVFKK